MIARMVSGLSHSASSTVLRPASMRLAISISPSRESSSIVPISRRYMRTGSSVRPRSSSNEPAPSDSSSSFSRSLFAAAPFASPPPTLTPISSNMAISSSTTSGEISSSGKAALISSWVTKPRSRACIRTRLMAGTLLISS